jgi:VWFA-related protein
MSGRQSSTTLTTLVAFALVIATSLAGVPPTRATPLRNGANSSSSRTENRTIRVQSPLVTARFVVTDRSGYFVEDLKPSDVRVEDDGVRQRITHLGLTTEPVAAAIVVQTNQDAKPFLDGIRPLGSLFSGLLVGGAGKAAVLTYSDDLRWAQAQSSDPAKLKRALRGLEPDGAKARLNDALSQSILRLTDEAKTERRVIIVFSDGADHGSATRGDEIVREASDANVQIYGLRFQPAKEKFKRAGGLGIIARTFSAGCSPPPGMPPAAPRGCWYTLNLAPLSVLALKSAQAELRTNLVGQYAGYTGGVVYTPLTMRSVQNDVQQIALDVNSEYTLAYVPNTLKQSGFHHIEIQVSRPDVRVRTKAGYFYERP